ncbi:hypothetical protein BGW80DRAFT_674585 [Lactifluus volemus]|nr:hypothetical protein BGW80DRAFT_674585 [Lactifluus volemus]
MMSFSRAQWDSCGVTCSTLSILFMSERCLCPSSKALIQSLAFSAFLVLFSGFKSLADGCDVFLDSHRSLCNRDFSNFFLSDLRLQSKHMESLIWSCWMYCSSCSPAYTGANRQQVSSSLTGVRRYRFCFFSPLFLSYSHCIDVTVSCQDRRFQVGNVGTSRFGVNTVCRSEVEPWP